MNFQMLFLKLVYLTQITFWLDRFFLALQKGYFFDVSSTPYDTGVVTNIQESPSKDRVQLYSYK